MLTLDGSLCVGLGLVGFLKLENKSPSSLSLTSKRPPPALGAFPKEAVLFFSSSSLGRGGGLDAKMPPSSLWSLWFAKKFLFLLCRELVCDHHYWKSRKVNGECWSVWWVESTCSINQGRQGEAFRPTRGNRGTMPRAPKSPNNVATQVLSSIQCICFWKTSGLNMRGLGGMRGLGEQHEGGKLASCPGRHPTSVRPWLE